MAAVEMPRGLVTMAFTDIEGSTKLLQRVGDRWANLLAAHHEILRGAIKAHDGYEVNTAGDGFFVTFARTADGIGFAVDAQRALAAHPLLADEGVKVRMGLHAGEVEVSAGDYLGLAVHHAARVGGASHGGQVLVTEPARVLAESVDAEFIDLGNYELKDLAQPVRLFQLSHPDLGRSFPPIRALNVRPNNLPVMRTTFVGRDAEIADLRQALEEPGLVTLTGPGGCGKTRLAVESAREALDLVPGGAWFVDLRDAVVDDDVPMLLAAALELAGVDDAVGAAAARLGGDPSLLILDNCEHLVATCADLADRLLESCPDLRIIATSRDLLGINAEAARRVASLDAEQATVLFVDRARRAAADVDPDDAAIGRICARLDGIPLAIELAAARVRHMSVATLESRLDDMFAVLVGSDRRALQRQQTLEAVIDWSYQLLTPEGQAVLRGLSVFSGSFTIDAAAAVTGAGDDVFDLIDRSLVERVENDRYRLLETIRTFAQLRLNDTGEAREARDRHLAYYVAVAQDIGPRLRDHRFFDAIFLGDAEADNLRAALEWAVGNERREDALRLVAELGFLFAATGRSSATGELVDSTLDLAAGASTALHARAASGACIAGFTPGFRTTDRAVRAIELYEDVRDDERDDLYGWALAIRAIDGAMYGTNDAISLSERARDVCAAAAWEQPRALALASLAWAVLRTGDLESGRSGLSDALEVAEAAGGGYVLAMVLFWSGLMSMHAHDWAVARRFYERALPMVRRLPHKVVAQWTLDHVASACLELDDLPAARAYSEEGLAVSRAGGIAGQGNYPSLLANLALIEELLDNPAQAALYQRESVAIVRTHEVDESRARYNVAGALAALGRLEVASGDVDAARHAVTEAVDLIDGLEPIMLESAVAAPPPVGATLTAVAALLAATGRERDAVVLRGAAEAFRLENDYPEPTGRRAEVAAARAAALRDAVGESAYDAAWSDGLALAADHRIGRMRALLS